MNNYITAGELAKLADTTKRTVLWYDKKGVLTPKMVDANGIRQYSQDQILDYQRILLLSNLGVSLQEIKTYLDSKGDLADLFAEKQKEIRKEVELLNFSLANIETFTKNIKDNGTMIKPEVKTMKPFDVYYIEKVGSYVKIGEYCEELTNVFSKKGKNFTTMAIFEDSNYNPKKSEIKIAAIVKPGMVIKGVYLDTVKRMTLKPGKVITYTHKGSGSLLSLFWKELEKYCTLHSIKVCKDVPDFEIYTRISEDKTKQRMEIFLPII